MPNDEVRVEVVKAVEKEDRRVGNKGRVLDGEGRHLENSDDQLRLDPVTCGRWSQWQRQ